MRVGKEKKKKEKKEKEKKEEEYNENRLGSIYRFLFYNKDRQLQRIVDKLVVTPRANWTVRRV